MKKRFLCVILAAISLATILTVATPNKATTQALTSKTCVSYENTQGLPPPIHS